MCSLPRNKIWITNVELLKYSDCFLVSALWRTMFPSLSLCRYSLSARIKRQEVKNATWILVQPAWQSGLDWLAGTWYPIQVVGFPPDCVIEVILKCVRPFQTTRFWNMTEELHYLVARVGFSGWNDDENLKVCKYHTPNDFKRCQNQRYIS